MGAFWADAESIFEVARREPGASDCDWAILIGPQGGIQMLDAAGWALPGLLAEHGAQRAYRVTRKRGSVRLEGRSGSETCELHSESPARAARHLLARHAALAGAWSPAMLAEAGAAQTPAGETWTRFA